MTRRILFIASAVGPFGEGATGGVSLFARNSIAALARDGIEAELIAPKGAALPGVRVHQVAGRFQPTAAALEPPENFTLPPDSLLAAMLARARDLQGRFDVVVNLNHDWLPVYLTPFFDTPVTHIPNLGHSNLATDTALRRLAEARPGHVAVLSRTHAGLLGLANPPVIPFGLELERYRFEGNPGAHLAWAGRISPEKGLEDAAEIAAQAGLPLAVAGSIEDESYWRAIEARYGDSLRHVGFLGTDAFQAFLGDARALLQTQSWQEALGVVTLEALACGTPVVAYARGANAEIVEDGRTGLLVAPGDIEAAVRAVRDVARLERRACRAFVDRAYGLDAMAAAYRNWLETVIAGDAAATPASRWGRRPPSSPSGHP